MKTGMVWVVWILGLGLLAGCEESFTTVGRDEAVAQADAAAAALTGELMGRLGAAMQEGGPARAVKVCSEVAQDVTSRIGGDGGLVIRRTSLRTRNPSNAPDPFERAWLEAAEASLSSGEEVPSLYQVVDTTGGGSELRHLRPIIFPGGVCAKCHGSEQEISPEVRQLLAERYPNDRAVGFQPGDLRGAISVRVPLR